MKRESQYLTKNKAIMLEAFRRDLWSQLDDRPRVFDFAGEEQVLNMYPRTVRAYVKIYGIPYDAIQLKFINIELFEAIKEIFYPELVVGLMIQNNYRYQNITPMQALFDVLKELTIRVTNDDILYDDSVNEVVDEIEKYIDRFKTQKYIKETL